MADCPFRLCGANVTIVVEQASADDDETTISRVGLHTIDAGELRGMCPGSLLVYPVTDPFLLEFLEAEAAAFERVLEERQRRRPTADTTSPAPEHSKTPHPAPDQTGWFRTGTGDPRVNGPVARPKIEFLPTPGGARMSDSIRQQLRSLTGVAINGFATTQEVCAELSNQLELLEHRVNDLSTSHEATHNVALSAVGTDENPPETASNMVGSSAMAMSTIDDLIGTLNLALVRVAAIHGSASAAARNGAEYLASI